MTSEGLGEMFEGNSADMCARKFPLVSMGGRAEGLVCADPGARTPIGASGNFLSFLAALLGDKFGHDPASRLASCSQVILLSNLRDSF